MGLAVGVVAAANEGAGLHPAEVSLLAFDAQEVELFRLIVADDRQIESGWAAGTGRWS